jgi:PAS domain S-box-containing protein
LLFTQALVEAIPSPVFYKNKEGEYLGCNQAFETAFGLSRQDILGKTVYDVMPRELADIYYAMDKALFQEPGRQVYESQVGIADGTRREVIFNKATFTDASGELSGLVGVILDITERKQMEEALRLAHDELETRVRKRTRELARINDELNVEIAYRKQAEEGLRESQTRLLKAQRIAQLGNWDWDIIGGSLIWSDEIYHIFGLTPQQLGATFEAALKVVHPDDLTHVTQSVEATLREGKPYNINHRIVLPDGSIRHVHEQAEVELDDTGQPVRMQGTVQDITERKRLEQQIIEVSEDEQKRIGQELHDGLGQHLTGIAFLSKVLEHKLAVQSLPEAMDASEIVKFVNQGISQTRALARNLFPVELENNGLMSALEQLASNINKLFGISCAFTCDNPVLVHDRIAAINLYRIAQEAANNAAKHSKADNIRITLAAADGKIHLSVTDDGIGFDPTRRANHEGMGCHIMRYRADMLGASLLIQKAADSGTEVRVAMDW